LTWPVRSKQLGLYVNASAPASTPITIGTVPAGKTWLVKDWSFYNAAGTSRQMLLFVKQGANSVVADSGTAASGTVTGNNGRHLVLQAGDVLQIQFQQAGASHVTISGAQLG